MGNVNVTEQYQKAKSAKGSYSQISGRIGIYAIQNKNRHTFQSNGVVMDL